MSGVSKKQRQMWRFSASETNLMILDCLDPDPYRNLASAIVAVAADDYRYALKENDTELKSSLEKFFFSDWYKVLTTINPNLIIEMISEEVYLETHPAQ